MQTNGETRVVFEIATRKECIPRVLKYDTSWEPFGTVIGRESVGTLRRQDTIFTVKWNTDFPTDIVLQLPKRINGKECVLELKGGCISVPRQEEQECEATYSY